jgi:predicted dehydrogenase
MAEEADFLLDERFPFAIEKPGGVTRAEVSALAHKAEATHAFAAVPFVLRQSGMLTAINELAAIDTFIYLSFRWICGPTRRYVDWNSSWMLDPAQAGGGCLLNLGVHYLDLFQALASGSPASVRSATTSHRAEGRAVEDYAVVTLVAGDAVGMVETGYTYPGPGMFDMRYSIRTDRHYFVAPDPDTLVVTDLVDTPGHHSPADVARVGAVNAGLLGANARRLKVSTTNVGVIPLFCTDILDRVRRGDAPVAGLSDMAATMRLAQDAYDLARGPSDSVQ